jgi:hypothetical protein
MYGVNAVFINEFLDPRWGAVFFLLGFYFFPHLNHQKI